MTSQPALSYSRPSLTALAPWTTSSRWLWPALAYAEKLAMLLTEQIARQPILPATRTTPCDPIGLQGHSN